MSDELSRLEEKGVSSEKIFDGVVLHVRRDEIVLPNGEPSSREYLRHGGAVAILPLTDKNEIILERQFRYPVGCVITEIPAGKLNSKSEDHLEAAKRELEEETGLCAKKWTPIGIYNPAPAYSDERIWAYLAEDLYEGKRHLDDDEFLDVMKVPFDKAVEMVMSDEIYDGKTQIFILKVKKILEDRQKL